MEKVTKINLASGRRYLNGYLNIDNLSMNPKSKVDIKSNVFAYSCIKFNTIEEIRLHHFMMYVNPRRAKILFRRWWNWLKKDGELIIETSDARSIAAMIIANDKNIGQMFGYGDTSGHVWSYTPKSIKEILKGAGFSRFSIKRGGTHGRIFRDFTITATK